MILLTQIKFFLIINFDNLSLKLILKAFTNLNDNYKNLMRQLKVSDYSFQFIFNKMI